MSAARRWSKDMNTALPNTDPAAISKAALHLLTPTVNGILRRFNDDATRPEAALSAVVVLQALKAMGVFDAPLLGQALGTFTQPAPGQRPVLTGDIAKRLEDELRKPPAEQPRTYLQNTGE